MTTDPDAFSEARNQDRRTTDIAALFADRLGATQDHIVHKCRI